MKNKIGSILNMSRIREKKLNRNEVYPIVPPLDSDLYADFYELRKTASTMTANTCKWLCDHAEILLEKGLCGHTSQPLSILSVGSGEGDVDITFIRAILPHLNSQQLRYDALEPNLMHHKRFLNRLGRTSFDKNVSISVHRTCFDELDIKQQYDLVLFIHVLYYFDDPYQAIRRALANIKPGGHVVIIHQSSVGIPEIQRKHMYELKKSENEILTTDDIKMLLDERGEPYRFYDIDAYLEVTECLNQSEIGLKIMSFCMECDVRDIDHTRLDFLTQSFSELAEIGENGSPVIYEPLGVFLIEAHEVRKIAEDNDPLADYRQLAQKFDWNKFFSHQPKSNLRILDVACGTGRWLQAFLWYVKPRLSNMEIFYDLLDPSQHVVSYALDRIEHPLKIGDSYVDTLQGVNLPKNFYDIIWSMHGFYAIPRQDIPSVLKKMTDSLTDTGRVFIAQATRKSFYVEFYDKLLNAFNRYKKGFTSAEDIINALNILGLEYQIYSVTYDERIDLDDPAALEHYILTESVSNSFIQEEVAERKTESKQIVLEDLFNHPKLDSYLQSFIKSSMYCFPQEIWLISFGKSENKRNMI